MITVIKKMVEKMITVIIPYQNKIYMAGSRSCGKNNFSDVLSLNYCNQKINPLSRNHRNRFTKKTKGQSITEYTVFITVVVMALLAMQVYFKRGIQGKIKDMVGYLGSESYNPNSTYADYYSNRSAVTETSYESGISTTQILLDQENKTGTQTVFPEAVN